MQQWRTWKGQWGHKPLCCSRPVPVPALSRRRAPRSPEASCGHREPGGWVGTQGCWLRRAMGRALPVWALPQGLEKKRLVHSQTSLGAGGAK